MLIDIFFVGLLPTVMLLAVVVPSLLNVTALPVMATSVAGGIARRIMLPSSTNPPELQSVPLQVFPLALAQTVTSLRRSTASLLANCKAPSKLLAADVLRFDATLL